MLIGQLVSENTDLIGGPKNLRAMLFSIHLLLLLLLLLFMICLHDINLTQSLFLFRCNQDQLPEKLFNTSVRMPLYF